MSNQSAHVTCDANYFTNTPNWQVNSYSVSGKSSGMLSDFDTRHKPVQCLIPEVPPARSLGGTTFGKSCTVTCNEVFIPTGLGGDVNQQTLKCGATGHVTSWKECERVRGVTSPRIVSRCNRRLYALSGVFWWDVRRTRAALGSLWTVHLKAERPSVPAAT